MARDELLHSGLLEGALLGDELVQPVHQGIHRAQRCCNRMLLSEGGKRYVGRRELRLVDHRDGLLTRESSYSGRGCTYRVVQIVGVESRGREDRIDLLIGGQLR